MLLWTILCLGAVASSIPNSHKLRLPFVPSSHNLEDGVRSRLSISLSIQNGTLYANEHQVYPPSDIMQLHAPLYECANQINPSDKTVDLSYTLETQTLPTDERESTADMIRIRIEWFDLQGNLVSPDAVAVDLLAFQNGKYEMTRIRVEPARGSDQEDRGSQKSQTWVMNYWRTQFGSIFDKPETKSKTKSKTMAPTRDSVPVTESSAQNRAIKVISSKATADSGSETRFFSFWATPAYLHHHAEHRRPHHNGHHKNSFMRIIRPIILPALLGTAAGLVACLVGFFIGELLMSLGVRLGWQKILGDRSRIISVEEGTVSEKTPMVPHVYVTDTAESNA